MPRNELLVIENFKDDYAVIKYGTYTFSLPRNLLPRAAKEGDILKLAIILEGGGDTLKKNKPRNKQTNVKE
ncbi:MAG: DUF3006 domain-containing protein [Clostridia bacterium]|nr:DUF3006 domain-containing protein [Clostridia bacterium]